MKEAVQIIMLGAKDDTYTRGIHNILKVLPGDQNRETTGVTTRGMRKFDGGQTVASKGADGARAWYRDIVN